MSAAATFTTETYESVAAIERYQDSYRAAEKEIAFGESVWFAGIVVGGVILVASLVEFLLNPAEHHGFPVVFASFIACAVLVVLVSQVLGTVIRGQGQLLSAAVDSDVNSSPFLSNAQRARTMRLKKTATMPEPIRMRAA